MKTLAAIVLAVLAVAGYQHTKSRVVHVAASEMLIACMSDDRTSEENAALLRRAAAYAEQVKGRPIASWERKLASMTADMAQLDAARWCEDVALAEIGAANPFRREREARANTPPAAH